MKKYYRLMMILFLLLGWGSAAAQDGPQTIIFDDLERAYHLYVPDSVDAAAPAPLVIGLHAFASSGQAFAALSGINDLADEMGFIAAYPDSLDLAWNEGRLETVLPPLQAGDDVGFIAAMIDEIGQNHPLSEVHLVGLSNGGLMAYSLACQLPERFASVMIVASMMRAYQREDCPQDSAAPDRLLMVVGTLDSELTQSSSGLERPLDPESVRDFWLGRAGCAPASGEVDGSVEIHSNCEEDKQVALIRLPDVKDNWLRKGAYQLNQFGIDLTEILGGWLAGDVSSLQVANDLLPAESVFGGQARTALIYVPPSYTPEDSWPVVVGLHGRPSSAGAFAYTADLNRVAVREGFIVVYPDGINSEWNYVEGLADYQQTGVADIAFLGALLDDLALDLNIDADRVYLTGFSNGGFMTMRMACDTTDRFAAYAPGGALAFPGIVELCQGNAPAPILLINGTDDPSTLWDGLIRDGKVFFPSAIDTVSFWVERNQCNADSADRQTWPVLGQSPGTAALTLSFSDCPDETEVVFYIIQGGGHTLPGMADRFPDSLGATNMDVVYGEVIWSFFEKHTKAQRE